MIAFYICAGIVGAVLWGGLIHFFFIAPRLARRQHARDLADRGPLGDILRAGLEREHVDYELGHRVYGVNE